jgi:hypothetical protein
MLRWRTVITAAFILNVAHAQAQAAFANSTRTRFYVSSLRAIDIESVGPDDGARAFAIFDGSV